MSLYVYAEDPALRDLLKEHLKKHRWTDSGFDIPMLSPKWSFLSQTRNYGIKLGIKVAAVSISCTPSPCLLLPRSSIGSTPFRLTNSIGLIDQGYRGEVQAKVDVHEQAPPWENGTRMFQICRRDFLPWNDILIVNSESDLPAANDDRGAGGFGSTGVA
jgi:dUTP pyrophosphatase